MFFSALLVFSLIVLLIAMVTAKINAKVPCDHDWTETEERDLKCSKCFRVIRQVVSDVNDTAVETNADIYAREGITIPPQLLEEA